MNMNNLSPKRLLSPTLIVLAIGVPTLSLASVNESSSYKGSGSVTQGLASTLKANIFECEKGSSRVAGIGEIKDVKGNVWTVPGTNHFANGPKSMDLYEECAGITPASLNDIDEDEVAVVSVDPEGEVITGYIFADNYFELYVNGILIAVDTVPFTPFNSSIVKFKVSKPYTIAVKVIDWEENLGLGTEDNRGKKYHPGDGGFIASFSDGTVTNADWQAQTFYTAPVYELACLSETVGMRLSKNCTTEGTDEGQHAYGVHWKIPDNWMSQQFNSTSWPQASIYTENEIGVDNKKAYVNFIKQFSGAGASFIWSTNVVLDNEVLLRYQVK